MTRPWEPKWERLPGAGPSGGQGVSFLARGADGETVFVKAMRPHLQRISAARGRFAREAGCYQTLAHPGLPRLIDHNMGEWEDRRIDLFLVLEHIEGVTLARYVADSGPIDFEAAMRLAASIAAILTHCHENDVVHRDMKPTNVMLRNSRPDDPVVIDFGLSFNDSDPESSDLTRVNEEVGNRFLRLPEHSTGGRSPVSDVTQLAGVLFFALTGIEPRVLVDEQGQPPHRRAVGQSSLEAVVPEKARQRVFALFDRAFRFRLDQRIQTAAEFSGILNNVMTEPPEEVDLDQLFARLDEASSNSDFVEAGKRSDTLQNMTSHIQQEVKWEATRRGVGFSRGGGPNDYYADPPYALLRLAFTRRNEIADSFVHFRFESIGTDVVVTSDDQEVWRGADQSDPALLRAVLRLIITHFLERT